MPQLEVSHSQFTYILDTTPEADTRTDSRSGNSWGDHGNCAGGQLESVYEEEVEQP